LKLKEAMYQSPGPLPAVTLTDSFRPYHIFPARVVKNSVNSRNNYLVVDQGSEAGVRRGMGVLHDDGPVGIVIATTRRFSKVLSILHSEAMISAAIERTNYFGSLVWRSNNPEMMRLEAVPKHANIKIGDAVVTSGQSVLFPPDFPIGVVDTFWIDRGSSFYSIDVSLSLDISSISHVYLVDYAWSAELDSLDNVQ